MSLESARYAKKIASAFNKGTLIAPLPVKFTKKSNEANRFRIECEKLITSPIIGFKAGGTGKPMLKKLGEKEPFYAAIYKKNLLKSNGSVKINKYTLGIELEVFYQVKKSFFLNSKKITEKNVSSVISHMGPCIEVVGYRQKKKGLTGLGDLISDFGANVKFIIGKKQKFKKLKFNNLATSLYNKKSGQVANGNTKTVYDSPLKSLIWLLNKIKKNKTDLNKDFLVFTGSTVGVVPIQKAGLFKGEIKSLGSVKAKVKN
ncbi:fumarylacetoacetate hydrolase [Pelagibacteraceae bacterium]|nr:fumarylacetoacetate hydrolase [Pelagibacteraceae bacterium]MDC0412915.1 fumarylacetoacetate hydrolase [Pelagibacteraceae bacterium]|tara:strand:+ start:353 stop:1129 length:777 start_codon:yes stop_codon:yes gene_type:complete